MSEKGIYKTIDLFGKERINFIEPKKSSNKILFDDYEGFLDKFEVKKTTDDCYTPDNIYKLILDYVKSKIDLSELKIIRPFYPDGDFENIDYPKDCIVIDNPPFSIISKIVRFYIDNDIKFFLFAPHLTLFSANLRCTAIVSGCDIVYENGATVKTSFLSNLFGDIRIMTAPELYNGVNKINNNKKVNLPKYEYPNNILTVSQAQKIVEGNINWEVSFNQCKHIYQLESQKKHKKTLFGSGFLLSEKVAAEKVAAEKVVAEKEIKIIWELSHKELEIIKSLDCDNRSSYLPNSHKTHILELPF